MHRGMCRWQRLQTALPWIASRRGVLRVLMNVSRYSYAADVLVETCRLDRWDGMYCGLTAGFDPARDSARNTTFNPTRPGRESWVQSGDASGEKPPGYIPRQLIVARVIHTFPSTHRFPTRFPEQTTNTTTVEQDRVQRALGTWAWDCSHAFSLFARSCSRSGRGNHLALARDRSPYTPSQHTVRSTKAGFLRCIYRHPPLQRRPRGQGFCRPSEISHPVSCAITSTIPRPLQPTGTRPGRVPTARPTVYSSAAFRGRLVGDGPDGPGVTVSAASSSASSGGT